MNKKNRNTNFAIGFKSIQSTIFAAVSVLVLCAVIVATFVSVRYTNSAIYENSAIYTQTIIKQLNQNIDSYITYMDNIDSVIAKSQDAYQLLYQKIGEDDAVKEGHKKRLLEQFSTILKGRGDICNIGIVQKDGVMLINSGYQAINPDLDLSTQEWYTNAVDNYNHYNLTSSHVQHVIKGQRPWVITLSREVHNFYGTGNSDGVVFIDLNYSAISELCDQNSIGDKGYVFILDQDGNIVYHPSQQQLYNELQTENIDIVMNADSDTVVTGEGDDEKVYTFSHSDITGWTVVGCMNMAELLKSSREANNIYVMTAIVLIAIAMLISSFVARSITLPIQKLRDSMEKVQEGDFKAADVVIPSKNEIGSLTTSFNVMTHKIEDLMAQNVHEQEQKRKSELKALQSQINPHFLYNTLDSIIWMAEGKKYEDVVLMTASLARLLRQSISNEDETVLIGQEIQYVKSYLTIQKMRYKDKLEFEIHVDPSIMNTHIVKLTLQPIVENAIYHGLKYKETKGILRVTGYQRGQEAVLEVSDDGVGMDEETLKHIFEKHKVNYRSNGVGVYNVQRRLSMYYGKDYGLRYKSEKGKGTTVTVVIPMEQEEHDEEA